MFSPSSSIPDAEHNALSRLAPSEQRAIVEKKIDAPMRFAIKHLTVMLGLHTNGPVYAEVNKRVLKDQLTVQTHAFCALQLRFEAAINYLNRTIGELETEKDQLLENLESRNKQLANLSAEVASLKCHHQELVTEKASLISLHQHESDLLSQTVDRVSKELADVSKSLLVAQQTNASLEFRLVDERERTMDALCSLAAAENRQLDMTTEIEVQRHHIQAAEARQREMDADAIRFQEAIQDVHLRNEELLYELESLKSFYPPKEESSTAMQDRVQELVDQLAEKDGVIDHVSRQATALVINDLSLRLAASKARKLQAEVEHRLVEERATNERLTGAVSLAGTKKKQLLNRLVTQANVNLQLKQDLASALKRAQTVGQENAELNLVLATKEAEITETRDVSVKLSSRIADLEEELVNLQEQTELSLERSLSEIEEERQRRNNFEAVASETLEAIIAEKERLNRDKKDVEAQLVHSRTKAKEREIKMDTLKKINTELQEALMKVPAASELHQAQRIVRLCAEHIYSCSSCWGSINRPRVGKENDEQDSLLSLRIDSDGVLVGSTSRKPLGSRTINA